MGIKARLLRFYGKFKKPSALKLLQTEVDFKMDVLSEGINNFVKTNIENAFDKIKMVDSDFKKESKLRKAQSTRLLKKVEKIATELAVNVKESNANFKFMNDKQKKLDVPLKKIDEMDDLVATMKKELATFRKLNEKLEILNGIHEKVKVDYDRYLKDLTDYHKTHIEMLHRDISEYKKNDNAVVRLSSLESRITLLELKQKDTLKESSSAKLHTLENRIVG